MLSVLLEYHYEDTDVFGYDNGLNVAAAFTAYDGERSWILDDSYGELVFNRRAWGYKPDGNFFSVRERLNSHVCSRKELGLDIDVEDD